MYMHKNIIMKSIVLYINKIKMITSIKIILIHNNKIKMGESKILKKMKL